MQPRTINDLCNEKFNFLSKAYDFAGLKWDNNLRQGEQMVSALLSREVAIHFFQLILQMETETNHTSLKLFASQSEKGKYRIIVNLNHYDLDAANEYLQYKQAVIIDFLNAVHRPQWRVDLMKQSNTKWEIHHNEICFSGPSCGYYPDLEIGVPVSNWLFDCFDKQATEAGFTQDVIEKFKRHLQKEDHKSTRVHYLKNNHFVQGELFLLAQVYCSATLAHQTQAFAQETTTAALGQLGLPTEICNQIGFFVRPTEARSLAQVNQRAANAASLVKTQFIEKT